MPCGKLAQEVFVDVLDAIGTGLAVALFLFGLVTTARRFGKNASRYTSVSPDSWQSYALSRGWTYNGGAAKGTFRGELEGQPLAAEVTTRTVRGRYGARHTSATSQFRVPIRGLAPVLSIRARSWKNRFLLVASGARPFATDVLALDEKLLISGENVDDVVALVRKPAVRQALQVLARVCPEAVVHERAVEMHMDGMMSEPKEMDRALQAMTAVAAAIEMTIPRLDGSAPIIPERLAEGDVFGATPQPVQLVGPDSQSRPRPLYSAMRRLTRLSSQQKAATIPHLRVPTYTFALEVRSIVEAESTVGGTTGDLQVNGVLTRSSWRVELRVPMDQANTVLSLLSGDVIRGECRIDDVRLSRETIEANTTETIDVVTRGTPHEDAVR